MGLLDKAREEMQRFIVDTDGFATEATFTAPDTSTCTVGVRYNNHKETMVAEGEENVVQVATIAVSEEVLKDQSYPTRDSNDLIHFQHHLVDVSDSTGDTKNYIIDNWYPDENFGLIVLVLKAKE